tara:strand:+ start:41 stop:190 length:150 start_codon:yes stop_codon:yes gene_type:complete
MDEELANDIRAMVGNGGAVVHHFIVESLAELVSAESVRSGELVEKVSES